MGEDAPKPTLGEATKPPGHPDGANIKNIAPLLLAFASVSRNRSAVGKVASNG
jgi:hypothetical protein